MQHRYIGLLLIAAVISIVLAGCGGGGGGGSSNPLAPANKATLSNTENAKAFVAQTIAKNYSDASAQHATYSKRKANAASIRPDIVFDYLGLGTFKVTYGPADSLKCFDVTYTYTGGSQIIEFLDSNGNPTETLDLLNAINIVSQSLAYNYIYQGSEISVVASGVLLFSGFMSESEFAVEMQNLNFTGTIDEINNFSWKMNDKVAIDQNSFPYPKNNQKEIGTIVFNGAEYTCVVNYNGTNIAKCIVSGAENFTFKIDLATGKVVAGAENAAPKDTSNTSSTTVLVSGESKIGQITEMAFTGNGDVLPLNLPTPTHKERYAVLLENNGPIALVKVNGGGAQGLANIRASRVASKTKPPCGTPFIKSNSNNALGSLVRKNMVSAIKASTRDESLGQTVQFYTYGHSISRTGVLRRIGNHCKIFVDSTPYDGLNAVSGQYAVTETQLTEIQNKFDGVIYRLMTENYGLPYDIDGDGKVAIFISPVVTKDGYAGYFLPGDFSSNLLSNHRDMLYLWSPYSEYTGDEWLKATCETVAHELQHLINYSEKLRSAGYPAGGLPYFQCEEPWLDEGLSVAAEIRYRLSVGDSATEDRFQYYHDCISSTNLTNCFTDDNISNKQVLAEYGCVGLFVHYLFEQGGADRIKELVHSSLSGSANIENCFADHSNPELRTFANIEHNWKKAVFVELNKSNLTMPNLNIPHYRQYKADFKLDETNAVHGFSDGFQGSISSGAMSLFIVEPSSGYNSATATIYLTADNNASINCSIMRIKD